jgi:hypothetical protein
MLMDAGLAADPIQHLDPEPVVFEDVKVEFRETVVEIQSRMFLDQ